MPIVFTESTANTNFEEISAGGSAISAYVFYYPAITSTVSGRAITCPFKHELVSVTNSNPGVTISKGTISATQFTLDLSTTYMEGTVKFKVKSSVDVTNGQSLTSSVLKEI